MQYSIKYNPMYAIRPHNNLQKVYKGKVIQNLTSGEPILHSVLVDLQINLNLIPSTQVRPDHHNQNNILRKIYFLERI